MDPKPTDDGQGISIDSQACPGLLAACLPARVETGYDDLRAMMRILHVAPAMAERYGGAPRVVRDLCLELVRQGHSVSVYTTDDDGKGHLPVNVDAPVVREGVEYRYFPAQWPRRFMMSWPLADALRESINDFHIVHIHALYRFPPSFAAWLCRRRNIPYILWTHGAISPYFMQIRPGRKRAYEWLVDRANIAKAAAVQFSSQGEMRDAERFFDLPNGVVIPNGLHPEEYATLPSAKECEILWPELAGKCVLLFLGRLHQSKGIDLLLNAFGGLVKEKTEVHLVIAGPDNDGYQASLQNQASEIGVLAHVSFVGEVRGHKKLALLARADMFVFASYSDSFGMAPLEAMACGIPVIVSGATNLAPLVQSAGAGIVTANEESSLRLAMKQLSEDAQQRKSMGMRGKAEVLSHYTWPAIAGQVVELYQEILARPKYAGGS